MVAGLALSQSDVDLRGGALDMIPYASLLDLLLNGMCTLLIHSQYYLYGQHTTACSS